MAGMLPGVECARRRRFHQNSGWFDNSPTDNSSGYIPTRRPSFCLYESHLTSTSSFVQRNPTRQREIYLDEKLGDAAREAKERLDEKLRVRPHSKSDTKRGSSGLEGSRNNMEVFQLKKRFSWTKLNWKLSSEKAEDCVVCLDRFRPGDTLMHLPCSHKFHSKCLLPWLDNNSHCPCCRLEIPN